MATFTPCVFEHQKREDGTFRVSFRITHDRKSVYLKTDIFVVRQQLTRDFKLKDHYLIVKLAEKTSEYQDKIIKRFGVDQDCTAGEIKEFLEKETERKADDIDFIAFSREHVEQMTREGRKKTAIPILRSLNAFIDFMGKDKVYFREITTKLLEKFGDYLKSERKIIRKNQHGNDVIYHLKPLSDYGIGRFYMDLRGLYYAGMRKYNDEDDSDEVLIKRNPFKKLDIKVKKHTAKRNIPIEEIRKIMHMPEHDKIRVNLARDIFMLSFMLVGINPVDLYNVSEIKNGRISYKRHKTAGRREDEAFISIKIEPEVEPLIEKYRDKTGKRVFDFYKRYTTSDIFDASLNRGLKIVGQLCGIEENLTMYVARHSWATIARNKLRLSVDDIAQSLNHVDNEHKTTFIYIEKDFTLIDEANRRMLDLLHESESR